MLQLTDVTDPEQVEALVTAALEAYGRLDCFAAIAGGGCQYLPLEQTSPEAWDSILRQNLTATFYSARAVVPQFKKADQGVFITCSGGGGFHPVLGQDMLPYACAKAGICRLTDQLTAELWDTAIRVNCMDPGLVWDGVTREKIAAEEAASGKPHPLRERNRRPEDAGKLAVWLASSASEPLRGRLVSVYDEWWRDPEQVAAVDQSISRYRLRRDDL
jgi:3-oxoacyl-[acyl-carrier protein] reductase